MRRIMSAKNIALILGSFSLSTQIYSVPVDVSESGNNSVITRPTDSTSDGVETKTVAIPAADVVFYWQPYVVTNAANGKKDVIKRSFIYKIDHYANGTKSNPIFVGAASYPTLEAQLKDAVSISRVLLNPENNGNISFTFSKKVSGDRVTDEHIKAAGAEVTVTNSKDSHHMYLKIDDESGVRYRVYLRDYPNKAQLPDELKQNKLPIDYD